MTDPLYPRDGQSFDPFSEPEEQVVEKQKKHSKEMAAVPKLKEILANLDADIDDLSRVSCITVNSETEPEKFLQMWHVAQEKKKYAEEMRDYIEQMIPENLRD